MASCAAVLRSPTPRTGSAKWGRPSSRPLPVAHPMASRSMDLDLTIRGTPTPGLEPEPVRILQWPPAHLQKPARAKVRVPKSTAWRSDNELVEEVREKLATGYEGVRQMFKAKDPYGDSIVTREGLFHIVKSLVGHLSREQYDSFLKTICLHWRSSVSFDEFIVRFRDDPSVAMHSVAELSKRQYPKPVHLEENLRSQDMLEWCPFTSAPHAFVMFRKKLQKGEVNIRDLLPAACFVNDGRVIKPQLREALAQVDMRLTDNEFDHIWLKFDPDNNGTVPTKRLYKTLELSPNGLPKSDPRSVRSAHHSRKATKGSDSVQKRCKTEMQVTSTTRQSTSLSKVDSVEITGSKARVLGSQKGARRPETSKSQQKVTTEVTTTEETETTTTTKTKKTTTEKREEQLVDDAKLSSHVRSLIQAKKAPPQFETVMDSLHYKAVDCSHVQFEETYRNLQSAFKLFDFMSDGYVARIDFRRVLREFGYDIAAVDLDAFLGRAGIGVVQGLINYNQFLQKFQSHSDSSVSTKAIARNRNGMTEQQKRIETEETLRAEDMEQRVVNFFHPDYIRLLNMLKQRDSNNTGVVPAQELRNAVDAVLNIRMSNAQFDELIQRLSYNAANGSPAIDYNSFLELFNSEPGHWNRRQNGQWMSQKYQLGDVAPASAVMRLQEKAKTWMAPAPDRDAAANSKVAEIRKELSKLFTDRFHVFDKNFQDMDRRHSGHMSKWQFGALIKLCGITLTVKDLDHLWATLDTAADNTLSYATLVKTFGSGQQKHQPSVAEKPSTAKSQKKSANVNGVNKQKTSPVVVVVEQPQLVTGSAKERRFTELLNKVKDDVLSRWDVIYSMFLSLDRDGYASVSIQDMRDIAYKMNFPLNKTERGELCNFFDLHANGWFHYLSFLQAVKKLVPDQGVSPCVYDIHTKRLHRKAGPTSMAITLFDFLVELKGILLKRFKTLRGSFKFFDLNHNGYIEEEELRKSFNQLGYNLCNQDFLDLMQVFDRSQGHRLSFEDFKTTLLTL
ncbi:uncharacterized protein LOC101857081 [Aplysia californica]|uniref:Uncharacterized protein LOC101857081 n=1 Tax=Aplysia californica TaxID=6500 RepID=A0ABM1A7I0_APLCA|nr:uncharacterized protein LOC101857081 [Aplysia californica]